ncbi:MAG TPA: MFS transporter, partial [Saprospiraceae bacterium]|nr:MFS transporter [Saprospiraceae bacterium]
QLLFTLPVYYKDVYKMSEFGVGALMASNGLIVFIMEMTFVYLVGKRAKHTSLILMGILTVGLSFIMLNWVHSLYWLILGMVVISIGEIMAMPFMQTFVANRAAKKSLGKYMAWYSFAYSASMIVSPVLGMWTIKEYGFEVLWEACMVISIFTSVGLFFIFRLNDKVSNSQHAIAI